MASPSTCRMTLPGPMLQRGFWLYVWQMETPKGEMLYVGRTGDNSSPHATEPYYRMGQHLGFTKTQNALRRNLRSRGIEPEECAAFHLIAHGAVHPEVEKTEGLDRSALMVRHMPFSLLLPRSGVEASPDAPASRIRNTGRWSGWTAFPRWSVGTRSGQDGLSTHVARRSSRSDEKGRRRASGVGRLRRSPHHICERDDRVG